MVGSLSRWVLAAASLPATATILYTLSVLRAYPRLPEQVPVHFDLTGSPNGWLPKSVWLLLSPVILAFTVALVFTTQPSPLHPTCIVYWASCGLIAGAFFEINQSATNQRSFHFLPLIYWISIMVVVQVSIVLLTHSWWKAAP